jgi:hypothetical protein
MPTLNKTTLEEAFKDIYKGKRTKMKKLPIILMLVVIGLAFGCNAEEPREGQKSKVGFEPVCEKKQSQSKDNYTVTTNWSLEERKECWRKNLSTLVGRTFTAYPTHSGKLPFTERPDTGWANEDFGRFDVKSPEKFTVVAIMGGLGSEYGFKIKFESGKIGYISGWLPSVGDVAFPELQECLRISYKASGMENYK